MHTDPDDLESKPITNEELSLIAKARAPVIDKWNAHKSSDLNLAAIEAFVIIAQSTSIAEGARTANVKEDTFRKRLDALESWANVSLLQRRPDIILTPDGIRFLPFAQTVCSAIHAFNSHLSAEQFRNFLAEEVRKPKSGSLRRYRAESGKFAVEVD